MKTFFLLYLIAFIVFFFFDILWLSLFAKNFYGQQIGFLMSSRINWVAAILFYLIFNAGLVFFVLLPAMSNGSWVYALILGAFFGLVTYSTYDLTNLATVKGWPVIVTVVDLVWGAFLCGIVSLITFYIANKLG